MSNTTSTDFLSGGGEMGALMRALDWSATPIGPVEEWSQALRTTVGLLLRNRFPLILWWGPKFVQFYNDTYRPILGDKHPKSMGQPASECYSEIWHIIGPMIEAPFSGLPATVDDDLLLLYNKRGFLEETYWKVAYSPVPDETVRPTGVGGVLATVAETTEHIYGERQLRTLRELGARSADAKTPQQACQAAAATLIGNPFDVPFALFYLLEPGGKQARLIASCGFDEAGPANPALIDIEDEKPWPLRSVVQHGDKKIISDLRELFGPLPSGRWSQSPHTAIVLPLTTPDQPYAYGVLIAGLNPHRELNDGYRTFFDLAAGQVTTAIRNAKAYQDERKRAEALAELDRAKTTFFSNVSHEFRTPLTLMLGPLEDLLSKAEEDLPSEDRDQISLVHRNGLRLLKLVNSLLDFSRIEAGRVQAVYEPTDLATFTAELSSVFRSAIEKAGLSLNIDCPSLPEPIYVDREMWEKVVLNLLSNAFKFTFDGEISVSLRWCGDHVEVDVKDTGTGIAPEELPHLFERFHRIKGARSRSYEGTGIGLALVSELVRLHGGSIKASSTPGKGTIFTVTIPAGCAHLPADRIGATRTLSSTSTGAAPYVQEALRWLPEDVSSDSDLTKSYPAYVPADGSRPRVLLADDNADMRGYIHRLLSSHYEVEAVVDGSAALDAAMRNPPDLVLTDIMMPVLDGFELLRALRADAETKSIPVIFLSARAGEEAKVEGMEAGADDYLVKPFSARELMARVAAHLQMARIRREAALKERELRKELEKELDERKRAEEALRQSEERYRMLFEHMNEGFFLAEIICDESGKPVDYRHLAANQALEQVTDMKCEDLIGKTRREALATASPWIETFGKVALTGQPESFYGYSAGLNRHYSISVYSPRLGQFACVIQDITERKKAEEALRESEAKLKSLAENVPCVLMRFDRQLRVVYLSKQSDRYNPNPVERMIGRTNREMGMPEHLCDLWDTAIERVFSTGDQEEMDFEFAGPSGMRTFELKFAPEFGPDHEVRYVLGVSSDITERKQAEKALREAKDHLEIRVKERTSELEQANRMLQGEVAERIRMGDALESSRQLLRHIIDNTPALVYVFDMEERFLVANKALGDLLSRLPEELIGKKRHEFMVKNIADRDEENDRQVVNAGVPMTFEEAGTFEGDEVITFLTVKFPIKYEQGEIYAVGGISTNITDRKQMEEELIRAKVAAEAASKAKAEFLANMSHEIRTPMNAVIGMTGLLLEEPLTPEQRDNLEHIRINGDALLTLINDILDFSKMESDKVVLEEYQFNLRQCVEEALDLVALRASEKGINLAYTIDKNVPDIIIGDFGRLRQILGNLLSNAVKFTDEGEVVLSVSSQELDGTNEVHFAVQDTGIGIPQDSMNLLFQPFNQIEPSTARLYGGTGLGLAISKKLVELMGGRIWVESEIGKGSTFHFTIKASSGQFKLQPTAVSPQMIGKHVLIIEDKKTNRRILAKQVYDWGMIPMAAASGHEAIKYIRRGDDFDIAILDMDLEDMSGLGLEEEIRKYNKTLPLVLLASLGKHVPPNHAYLTKPIKPSQMYKVLTDILSRQPLYRQVKVHVASWPSRRHTLRILLAEDNVSSQKVAQQMLKKLGYKVDTVANGIEALQSLERQHYDAVLMDVKMPEMDGLEASRIIRQRWSDNGPKIIAITAYALEGDREKCLEAGMDDYIAKPVEINDLRAVLERNFIDRKTTER
jgi:PAS domain S-box-containing protein